MITWGASTPEQSSLHMTFDQQASSDTNEHNLDIGLYVCHVCNRHHSRHCDLNKHLKTHSRSFKCPVQGCRYNTFGWPTEKELERHHNDKHSTSPNIFSCWYQPCAYTSKRESNCKQHMEKTHGWEYIRTRVANNREEGSTSSDHAPYGDTILVSDRSAPDLSLPNVPDFFLTPSPLGQRLSTPHDVPLPMGLDATAQYGSGVYAPWTSPVTPLEDQGPFVGAINSTYAPGTSTSSRDQESLKIPVDPRLRQSLQDATLTNAAVRGLSVATDRETMLKALPTIVTAKSSPAVKSQMLTPNSDVSPALFPTAVLYREVTGPKDSESSRAPGSSMAQSLNAKSVPLRKTDGKRPANFSKKPDDDSDDENEPPTKRSKGAEGGQTGDPKMICPFRAEHPDIYDRDLDPKYASCHTEHMNISTVVRHLGRPAHNLKIDNGRSTISSFDVLDPEYNHPAAGLCRTCWMRFDDRQALDDHVKSKCWTRSRSKREKFSIIRDTFCRLRSGTITTEDDSEKDDPPERKDMNIDADAQVQRLDVVSRKEFVSLVQRVTELEQILATKLPRSTPRIAAQQEKSAARALSSSTVLPSSKVSQPFGFYAYADGAGASRGAGGTTVAQQPPGNRGQQAAEHSVPTNHFINAQGNVPAFGMSTSIGSDNASLLRRESTPAIAGGVPLQQQRFGNNNNQRRIDTSTYDSPAAAMATGNPQARAAAVVDDQIQISGNQAHEFGSEVTSQESANTTMRNQWEHAVQSSDEMLQRGMEFFNNPYLDMGSQ